MIRVFLQKSTNIVGHRYVQVQGGGVHPRHGRNSRVFKLTVTVVNSAKKEPSGWSNPKIRVF